MKHPILIRSIIFLLLVFVSEMSYSQMRKLYLDNVETNDIQKICFYTPSEGFVAFKRWIGYTADSGRTFDQKPISISNVDFNGYQPNLTFGFGVSGVKAFNKDTIVVYGDYGLVPAILFSSNGGNTFKLVFHSQYKLLEFNDGVVDMAFAGSGSIGYAVDADRILKTTDKGLTWSAVYIAPESFFNQVQVLSADNVYASRGEYTGDKLVHSTNGGSAWQPVILPTGIGEKLNYVYFLDASTAWINGSNRIFQTTNAGNTWTQVNDFDVSPFTFEKMIFTDARTGYAISYRYNTYKTINAGETWELLPRDNGYIYLGFSHKDLFSIKANQVWAGGGHGFLEMSDNGGGDPIATAYFRIDTSSIRTTGIVNLINLSRVGYSHTWLLNNVVIGTQYHSSYVYNANRKKDTIAL